MRLCVCVYEGDCVRVNMRGVANSGVCVYAFMCVRVGGVWYVRVCVCVLCVCCVCVLCLCV